MTRVASILLLLPLLYTQVGYYGQFLFRQMQLREAAHEAWLSRLPDGKLYRVPRGGVSAWQDGGRECWYKGHLYDILREKKGYLFCLDDEREAQLIRQSGDMAATNLPYFPHIDAILAAPPEGLPCPGARPSYRTLSLVAPLRPADITSPPPRAFGFHRA